jgi:hypothetical protein
VVSEAGALPGPKAFVASEDSNKLSNIEQTPPLPNVQGSVAKQRRGFMEHSDGPERMVEMVTALSVLGEVLAALVVKLASATAVEIPTLCDEAEVLAQRVTECCADTAPVDHLPPEEAAAIRSDMLQLAEAMKAQIAGIVDLRLARFTGGVTSRTRH